jgi:hypothetical protein
MQPVMSDRTKLIFASIWIMMLPYRLDLPIAVLVITSVICTAIDMVIESWAQKRNLSRNFIAAISLYRRLKYYPV